MQRRDDIMVNCACKYLPQYLQCMFSKYSLPESWQNIYFHDVDFGKSEKSELVSGVFCFLAQHNFRFYEIPSAENSVQSVHYRPAYHLHLISIQNCNTNNTLPKGTLSMLHSIIHSEAVMCKRPTYRQ